MLRHQGRRRSSTPTGERRRRRGASTTARIAAVGAGPRRGDARCSTPAGCVVAPGLVDLHTHLREPGRRRPRRSRPAPGPRPSAASPRWWPCPTPTPAIDDAGGRRARCSSLGRGALCDVRTSRRHHRRAATGEQLAPMGELADARRAPLHRRRRRRADARLMRRALEYARALPGRRHRPALRGRGARRGRPHARGRVVEPARHPRPARPRPRSSWSSATSRWPGSPAPGSTSSTCRTAGSVELVRAAKAEGLPVTAEATPAPLHAHRRRAAPAYDPVFKVNPPLRTDADVAAVQAGLADGTIDAIATDHAPHAPGGQGAPVRRGAAGDARPRDRARPRAHRAGRAGRAHARARCSAACRGGRRAIAGLGDDARRAGRGRASPPTSCVIDPDRGVGGRRRASSPAGPATPPTPGARSPGGSATRCCAASPSSLDGEAQR